MTSNGMPLNKKYFILGNIAPDFYILFFTKPHFYDLSSQDVYKLSSKLITCDKEMNTAYYSYKLGVITHFVCDYFCYSHTMAYKGNLFRHMLYERSQKLKTEDIFPFIKHKSIGLDQDTLHIKFKKYVEQWESLLHEKSDFASCDISIAVHIAAWFTAAVYQIREVLTPDVQIVNYQGSS